MFALVSMTGRLNICLKKHIINKGGSISAKYKNKGYFSCEYVVYEDSKEILDSLKTNINTGMPIVAIGKTNWKSIYIDQEICNADISTDSDFNPVDISCNSDTFDESSQEVISMEAIPDVNNNLIESDVNTDFYEYERVNEDLVVSKSSKTKQYFCIFCKKMITKLARHLEAVHKNVSDVQRFLSLPKGCIERKNVIATLRKKGSFVYNTDKILNGGDMIVARRPHSERTGSHYKACPNCRGFFSKITLRRHFIKCSRSISIGQRSLMVQSRRVHRLIHPKANETLREKVFPVLRDDKIVHLIRYDELIILYGNKMATKYKSNHDHNMIRAKLRLLGRLLYVMRENDKRISDFASIYSPEYYDGFITAVNTLGELTPDGTIYKRPSVASELGTIVRKVGQVLSLECIKRKDETAKKFLGHFIELLDGDFGASVNRTVAESQSAQKRKKIVNLPIMDDIKLLNKYVTKKRILSHNNLKKAYSFKHWKSLASFTLISLLLLNRRRVGELERTLLSDFENCQSVDTDQNRDLYEELNEEDKKAAQRYVRITIRGKLGREVPVLIPRHELKCLKLIIKFRKTAGVSAENNYLFGVPTSNILLPKHLKACDLLREYSMKCKAKFPERLRGTLLRKHIATRSAIKKFDDNEVSDLANYLGHADKVHRDNYRMPLPTMEITRMSRVLEDARGNLSHSDEEEDSWTEKNPVRRVSWSEKESEVVKHVFAEYFESGSLPSLFHCGKVISQQKSLQKRTPHQLKAFINNQLKRMLRLKMQENKQFLQRRRIFHIRDSLNTSDSVSMDSTF